MENSTKKTAKFHLGQQVTRPSDPSRKVLVITAIDGDMIQANHMHTSLTQRFKGTWHAGDLKAATKDQLEKWAKSL